MYAVTWGGPDGNKVGFIYSCKKQHLLIKSENLTASWPALLRQSLTLAFKFYVKNKTAKIQMYYLYVQCAVSFHVHRMCFYLLYLYTTHLYINVTKRWWVEAMKNPLKCPVLWNVFTLKKSSHLNFAFFKEAIFWSLHTTDIKWCLKFKS